MQRKVAVVAAEQENSSDIGKSRERMLFDLVKRLYEKAGINRNDVGTFVICSNDFCTGHTISNVFEDCPIGAFMKDETKVEADGLMAATYAFMRILSGGYETALIVAHSQGGSVMRPYLMMEYELPPVYERQVGLMNELLAAAFQARAYLETFGIGEEVLNSIAARLLSNASMNPDAFNGKKGITPEDVSSSPYLYEPLHEMHCYPPTDGVCAVLLAAEEKAKQLTEKPVWIKGVGNSIDSFYLDRDLSRSESVKLASKRAFEMAGVKDPSSEIDLAEISVKFAHQEPIICEAMGLFPEGSAGKVSKEGEALFSGKMPVSPSGSGLGAYAFNAAGLSRIAECSKQLKGEAGEIQVEGAKTAVAHGQDGFCLQHNAVMVLSVEEG
ncbi:MAG: thiolase family protein [Actinomycetota bacterium]|nr:thiolase family protein [Actinomycetota bacterium]